MASKPAIEYDAIIVGSGFGGCYLLHKLRTAGFKCLVIDDAADLGGVWFWNCYRGARVDTPVPLYEFSDPDLWKDWTWSERYPGRDELRRYFDHVESKLHLKKDILFNTRVVSADFNQADNYWNVLDNAAVTRTARYFILCTGFAAKPFIPTIDGIDTFAGISCHTSKWPQGGIDFHGKRVGIVGNGSSGLQVIQDVASEASHMTVFQRSPTYALPMRQTPLQDKDQVKAEYEELFERRKKMFAGLTTEFNPQSAVQVSDEEREAFFEKIWTQGGLSFWLATYQDVIRDTEANKYAYEFWRKKTLPRIKKPGLAELLAPEKPPYYFGTKRATLEQKYYEVYNNDHDDRVSLVVPNGVITKDGTLRELDILIFATGFDSVTGGILSIDIKGVDGLPLQEKWKNGTYTHLGMMTAGFPNMMFLYGPQGPTSFCNGPTCAELQGDWIIKTIIHLRDQNRHHIDPTGEAEQEWRTLVNQIGDMTLLPRTKSEYMGTNIPGKPKEMLNFLGGLVEYTKHIDNAFNHGFQQFVVY
ncbi:Cyclopentanone 1,2-monooxygenase [Scedosporium apiospermum]|uniref:Cyclopentanone 1,2-monooxygenase n=1 Tax=Pseudallescheria apiosperma TaxID=563466 RepID=A0A084G2B9_PSEDA|nr:Cyclopentanone 1,2-monooxygenase [Scedosporium apiospermum]KEZ41481.1 Cyclopentanone 1,2-monooxygenase [Scedosporium apiospermum]